MADGKESQTVPPTDSADDRGRWWAEMLPRVLKYLRKRMPAHAAEDAAQETYVRMETAAAIRNPDCAIWRTAQNVAKDWYRSRARRLDGDTTYQSQFDTDDHHNPERASEVDSELQVVIRAAAELPPLMREMWKAASIGATAAEIAEQHHLPVRTVYRYLERIYVHMNQAREASERGGRRHVE